MSISAKYKHLKISILSDRSRRNKNLFVWIKHFCEFSTHFCGTNFDQTLRLGSLLKRMQYFNISSIKSYQGNYLQAIAMFFVFFFNAHVINSKFQRQKDVSACYKFLNAFKFDHKLMKETFGHAQIDASTPAKKNFFKGIKRTLLA